MATQYTAGLSVGQVLTAATMNSIGAVSETFTPTWTSSGTAPAIGNGTLSGRYFRIQQIVIAEYLMLPGSTTTFGTGQYYWSLPITARTPLFQAGTAGYGRVYDQSAGATYICNTLFLSSNTSRISLIWNGGGVVGQTAPFTWANGDEASFYAVYEAA